VVDSFGICPETRVIDNVHFLFDAQIADYPIAELFSCEILTARNLVTGWAQGRGKTCFFRWENQELVLRHFRRGGLVAKLLKDKYLGINPSKTRSWREWQLLRELYGHGFPVPQPVGASACMKNGTYSADLITVRIPDSFSLSDALQRGKLCRQDWFGVGMCLRKFHDFGVYHADLNANNILLDNIGNIFLIDFDRCEIRTSNWWKKFNLQRLHCSLAKLSNKFTEFHFQQEDWDDLLGGYSLVSDSNSL